MAAKENPLNRRAKLMEQEWERRSKSIEAMLFEPEPPFSVKMSEQDAFRKYLVDEQDGFFTTARESNGGHMRDEDVDAYSRWGQRMKAKYMPHILLRDLTGGAPEYAGIVDQVRLAHERLLDPNDEPEDWGGDDADEGFE